MKFDTEGTYTLQYKAVDECGNETTEDREVIVANPRTVLYTDGTFIINELPQDKASNEALHGEATNVYIPFDPNGATDTEKYIFNSTPTRPWNQQRNSIKQVKMGSHIAPTQTAYWFHSFATCERIDLSNLDTANVANMKYMFYGCESLESIDVSNFVTSEVTDMMGMFEQCKALKSLDLSSFDTKKVTNMQSMFTGEYVITHINVSSFDTEAVTDMSGMFTGAYLLSTIDVSSFDTRNVTSFTNMFSYCDLLETIYASPLFTTQSLESPQSMFYRSTNLVGGSGTAYSGSLATSDMARIDNPPDAPGYFTLKQA